MSKKRKHYAVRVGRKPGIYRSWNACKVQVHGYPGAKFKSFQRIEDAEDFVAGRATAKCRDKIFQRQNNIVRSKTRGWVYSGTTPPWDFPGDCIDCIEDGRQLEAEMLLEKYREEKAQIDLAIEAIERQ